MHSSKLFRNIMLRLLCLLVIALSACGPVNEKKPSSETDQKISPKALTGVTSTQKNLFYIYLSLQKKDTKLEVGDNIYVLRAVLPSDLSNLSDLAKVSVSYWMPDMPAMGKSDAVAVRQDDGTYTITLFYSMPGKWQATVTIQDGSNQDDYVFETTL